MQDISSLSIFQEGCTCLQSKSLKKVHEIARFFFIISDCDRSSLSIFKVGILACNQNQYQNVCFLFYCERVSQTIKAEKTLLHSWKGDMQWGAKALLCSEIASSYFVFSPFQAKAIFVWDKRLQNCLKIIQVLSYWYFRLTLSD